MPTTPHPRRGVTACTRCGAPVRWASGPQPGQRTPLNAMPSPAGGLAAHTNHLGGLVVRELTPAGPGPVRARPVRRRPTVQPPLFGQQGKGRWGR